MIPEPMPQWLQQFISKVEDIETFEDNVKPNHVLINEYLSGQGIMPHFDGPLFYPTIATISCGSHTVLNFTKPNQTGSQQDSENKEIMSILVEPRSLLVLKDSMYTDYQHCIEERHQDVITDSLLNINNSNLGSWVGKTLDRSTRISLTIRHVPKTAKVKIKLGR